MDKEKNLEYFKNLKYNVIIKKKGTKSILYISELSLIEEDESLDKAYEKLESEKVKYFQKMIEMEAQDEIIEPTFIKSKNKLVESLLLFSAKLAIVLFISGVASLFLFIKVKPILQNIITMPQAIIKSTIKSAIKPDVIIGKAMNFLDQTIVKINDMPEAKKERLRLRFSQTLRQTKPFFDEFKLLFSDKLEEELLTEDEITQGVELVKRYINDLRSFQNVIPSIKTKSRIEAINNRLVSFTDKIESLRKVEEVIEKKEITKVLKNFKMLVREVQASQKDFFFTKEEADKGKLKIDAILKQLKFLIPYNYSSKPR